MEDTYFVVAVDFGTAYSGYCFSIKDDVSEIRNPYWGMEYGFRLPKTPTCILFNEDKKFVKFGFDAIMTYKQMPSKEALRFYFFENFKMELYNKMHLKNLLIKAKNNKSLPALIVISESLRFLKDHALKMINESSLEVTFSEEDITWVLTVPAIWRPDAKQFMRQAAKEAGLVNDINSEKLLLALEPEAASLWCRQLPSSGLVAENNRGDTLQNTPGIQYVVVDCGGGTIDITVHEVLENNYLKEIQKASGGGWGGSSVDRNFVVFLRELFGADVWDIFEKQHPSELQKMMYNFSVQKCMESNGENRENSEIFFSCVFSLAKLAEQKKEISSYFEGIDGVSWSDGNIKIAYQKLKSFFKDSLTNIIDAIEDIIKQPEVHIDYILLVGGYAASRILRDKVYEIFRTKCKVMCPIDSQLAIAKGAILFGADPKIITSRVSALTYGMGVSEKFLAYKHSWNKRRVTTSGFVYCTDVFMKLVERGQGVEQNEAAEYCFNPVDGDQVEVLFSFFSTEKENAQYTDDEGVKEVGSIIVPIPGNISGKERRIKLEISFGLTEIKATATDLNTDETQKITLDFMTE
ncbi:heat shock 70 kDa protein 12A-like [Polypterus senegalus]